MKAWVVWVNGRAEEVFKYKFQAVKYFKKWYWPGGYGYLDEAMKKAGVKITQEEF